MSPMPITKNIKHPGMKKWFHHVLNVTGYLYCQYLQVIVISRSSLALFDIWALCFIISYVLSYLCWQQYKYIQDYYQTKEVKPITENPD